MHPILVYGYPAGSSMGLVAAFEYLGQPYQLCRVDMFGEMREVSYRRLNPRVETPVLITESGQIVTETLAIAAWLENRDTERRISFTPGSADANRMHQFTSFINSSFTPSFAPLWAAMEMEDASPQTREILQDFGRPFVAKRHDQLEEMIGDSPFLLGDQPTLADFLLIGVARWRDFHEIGARCDWSKLAAWRDRMEAERAVVFAASLEAGARTKNSSVEFKGHVELNEIIARVGS